MREDRLKRKIIIYGIAVIFICGWAVLNLIPYLIAMDLATVLLAISCFFDAKDAKEEGNQKVFLKKTLWFIFLMLSLIVILFIGL